VNIIKEELQFEESLKQRLEFICEFSKVTPTFINGSIRKDVVQLSFNGHIFSHAVIVVKNGINTNDTLIAAHTYDIFGKSIAEYGFKKYRCIHII